MTAILDTNVIVTGDQDLLVIRRYNGIDIVSPRDFLSRLSGTDPRLFLVRAMNSSTAIASRLTAVSNAFKSWRLSASMPWAWAASNSGACRLAPK